MIYNLLQQFIERKKITLTFDFYTKMSIIIIYENKNIRMRNISTQCFSSQGTVGLGLSYRQTSAVTNQFCKLRRFKM